MRPPALKKYGEFVSAPDRAGRVHRSQGVLSPDERTRVIASELMSVWNFARELTIVLLMSFISSASGAWDDRLKAAKAAGR